MASGPKFYGAPPLYFQDEYINFFNPGIEKEEKEITNRLDKVES
jgi:hypothetical protein